MNEHGGSSNAFTASEHTNYFFDVNCEHLEGALDRFAQFFVAPLFLAESTSREMQAVDSENAKNLLQDNWRLSQLEKHLSNPEHPYHKFSTGNMKTLDKEGIRDVLMAFHQRWYSANLMSLVVLGRESLDQLQEMVEGLFSTVVNKKTEMPVWKGQPWREAERQTFIRAKTVKDTRTLYLTFLGPDLRNLYLSKPQKIFSHLIGHEGQESILQLLKEKGWATSLSAGADDDAHGYSFFEVTIELSSSGLEHYREIVGVVFRYIEMLAKEGIQSEKFQASIKESMDLSNLGFRFKEREDASNFCYKTARYMHRYPPAYAISGPYIQEDMGVDDIFTYAKSLTRSNCRVLLATRDDPTYTGQWLQEKWYGTEYYVEELDKHAIEYDDSELHLPSENTFIPSAFDVLVKPASTKPVKQPTLRLDDERCKLHYKLDDTFETPKAVIRILLRSALPTASASSAVSLHLFVEMLKHHLTPIVYPAELAGLSYDISVVNDGIDLKLTGFAQKLHRLLSTILEEMSALASGRTSTDCFDLRKELYQKQLANLEYEQPYWHCSYVVNGLCQQAVWWYWQRIEALKVLKVEDVIAAGKAILDGSFAEVLVHGSISDPEIFTEIILKHVRPGNLTSSALKSRHFEGTTCYRLPKPLDDPNAAIEMFFQTAALSDTHARSLTGLLIQAISEPFFDQLRTKEQLGYVVFCGKREKYDQIGIRFVIQSTKGDPVFLEERIRSYLGELHVTLASMSEGTFSDLKAALIQKLRQKKVRLGQETSDYWDKIVPSRYDWNRAEEEAQYLELQSVTKMELESFAKFKLLTSPGLVIVQAWPASMAKDMTISYSEAGGPPLAK